MNKLFKSIVKLIFSFILLSSLYACGSGNNGKNNTTTEMPSELQKLTLTGGGTLAAFVTVDGNAANRIEMTIDGTGAGSASASIAGLSLAVHTIVISYEYTDGVGTIVLATASNTVDLTSGSGNLSFAAGDYDLATYDDDSDGISNAAELATGSDPRVDEGNGPCVFGTSTIGNCVLG